MARGSKASYTPKQRRKADHIDESARKQGKSEATAERIAWATVNKQDGGAKGKKKATKKSSKKSTKKSSKKSSKKKSSRASKKR